MPLVCMFAPEVFPQYVCTRSFPSSTSKHLNRNFHSPCVLVEQIPYVFNVIKIYRHWFHSVPNLSRFLRSWWSWSLPLRWLLLCLRVLPKHPSWPPVMMMKIKLGSLWSVPSARWRQQCGIRLIITQQPWHKFCCNALHVELMWQNSLACSLRQSKNDVNIVNRLSVFQIVSCTFATFLVVVPIKGHLETSSSSTDIRPFLKWLNQF